MSTGAGGKPPRGSQPGRPPADTPQRLVVRSLDPNSPNTDAAFMGGDTAVAVATRAAVADTSLSGERSSDGAIEPPVGSTTTGELTGTTLSGRYLVTRKIGQGGMGAVYEATHTLINKRVAVKVLLEKYAQREAIVKRLKLEAQLASSVDNEHIISVTDFGTTEDGRTFVVMEFLEGESLAECLSRESQLPEQRILQIISQAASALAAAHAKGVVHRDIKPENLFILQRKDADFVKVVDFGISKSLRATGEEEEATTRLTQTGMVLGTPLYMSPEQARGDEQLDHRVDVYALGVIMYEASTGRVPFVGNNYLSVISQVLNEHPASVRELRPELSEEFEAVVHKAMAKDVTERYASATAMLADVTMLLGDPTRSTERAKITGPRRRFPRKGSSSRYVVWAAGIAVVLASVVFSVTQLVGPSTAAKPAPAPGSADLAIVPPADAAVDEPALDAAIVPPPPKAEVVEVTFVSVPAGATVYIEGVEQGTTPFTMEIVKKDMDVKGIAQLDGYNDQPIGFNQLVVAKTKKVTFKLTKPPKGTPVQHRPIPKPGGADPANLDKTGGDLSGNPYSPDAGAAPR